MCARIYDPELAKQELKKQNLSDSEKKIIETLDLFRCEKKFTIK